MRPLVLLVVVSLIVVAGALAYPYLSTPSTALGKDQAVAFVLQDVQPLSAQGIDSRVVDARSNGSQWAVDVLLTTNGHSACPSVDKRFYTLPPVAFRTEPVLSSCNPTASIDYREEALIDSAQAIPSLDSAAYGCAFLSDQLNSPDVLAYCPTAQVSALTSFAKGLASPSWVVQWSDAGLTRFVALSSSGQVLKTA